jgi:hypothetical protein
MSKPRPRLYLIELLAKELETQTKIPFMFSMWVGASWKGDPDLSCGAPACAIGIATTMPKFRGLGLKLSKSMSGLYPQILDGDGETLTHINAVIEVFRITREEAYYLFAPSEPCFTHSKYLKSNGPFSGATAAEVAAHLRQYVAYKRKHEASGNQKGR